MAITLKNEKVEKMAREAAGLSGTSLTKAIGQALELRLLELRRRRTAPNKLEEILAISQRCAALANEDDRPEEKILGYDASGILPHGH